MVFLVQYDAIQWDPEQHYIMLGALSRWKIGRTHVVTGPAVENGIYNPSKVGFYGVQNGIEQATVISVTTRGVGTTPRLVRRHKNVGRDGTQQTLDAALTAMETATKYTRGNLYLCAEVDLNNCGRERIASVQAQLKSCDAPPVFGPSKDRESGHVGLYLSSTSEAYVELLLMGGNVLMTLQNSVRHAQRALYKRKPRRQLRTA
jgi:hypothetical protein